MDIFGRPLVQRQALRKPSRQKKTVRKRDIGRGAKGQIPELVTKSAMSLQTQSLGLWVSEAHCPSPNPK